MKSKVVNLRRNYQTWAILTLTITDHQNVLWRNTGLRRLCKNNDLVILRPDKGDGTVDRDNIIDR